MAKRSGDVKTKWRPIEGLFTKPAEEIAKAIKRASKDLQQAVDRATFYYNRAGNNEPREKYKAVLGELHKLYGKPASEAMLNEIMQRLEDVLVKDLVKKGLFAKSVDEIAKGIKEVSRDFKQAEKIAISYYDTMTNKDDKSKIRLNEIMIALRVLYGIAAVGVGVAE